MIRVSNLDNATTHRVACDPGDATLPLHVARPGRGSWALGRALHRGQPEVAYHRDGRVLVIDHRRVGLELPCRELDDALVDEHAGAIESLVLHDAHAIDAAGWRRVSALLAPRACLSMAADAMPSLAGLSALADRLVAFQLCVHIESAAEPEALQAVAALERLEVLDVRLTSDHAAAFAFLPALSNLRRLGVGGFDPSGFPVRHLAHLPALRDLAFTQGTTVDARALPTLPELRRLTLLGTSYDATLRWIGAQPHLEEVRLHTGPFTSEGLRALAQARALRVLELELGRFTTRAPLAFLRDLPKLERLGIGLRGRQEALRRPNGVSETPEPLSVADLAVLSELPRLRELTLEDFDIGVEEAAIIGGLRDLETLDVARSRLSERTLDTLLSPRLRTLSLACDLLAPRELSIVRSLPCLETLAASGVDGEALSWLDGHRTLADLSLRGDIDSAVLARLGELPALRRLALEDTGVDDDIAPWLARQPRLVSLGLADTRVRAASFTQLAHLVALRSIDLTRARVDDEGAAALASLPGLRQVSLLRTEVSDAGAALLRARGCNVLHEAARVPETVRDLEHFNDLLDRFDGTDSSIAAAGPFLATSGLRYDDLREAMATAPSAHGAERLVAGLRHFMAIVMRAPRLKEHPVVVTFMTPRPLSPAVENSEHGDEQ